VHSPDVYLRIEKSKGGEHGKKGSKYTKPSLRPTIVMFDIVMDGDLVMNGRYNIVPDEC
jgi:hypothetical protein